MALWMAMPEARADVHISDAGQQIRFGVLQHDLDDYGGSEGGTDFMLEYRGAPFSGAFWQAVLSPRPHVGTNFNVSGRTSSLYAGFTWMVDFGRLFYASADLGGAVHNGKLETNDPNRASLGARVLFREAVELGIRFGQRWRAGVRLDHISNADLVSPNDGITDFGVVFSREF